MRTKLFAAAALAATLVWAQGFQRRQAAGSGAGVNANLDLSRIQTIEGTVTAVSLAYGTEYPSITINQALIKVAPAWFLLENDFEIRTGDKLKVTAAPSLLPSDSYLHALTLTNLANNTLLVLRDQNGLPQWNGGRGPQRNSGAVRLGGGCLDPATITTVSGVVEKIMAGPGLEQPTLVLKTTDGKLITVKIGPEWILLAHDFELKAGEKVTVKYGVAASSGENLALELTNAAGVTIVLRNDDGTPAWN